MRLTPLFAALTLAACQPTAEAPPAEDAAAPAAAPATDTTSAEAFVRDVYQPYLSDPMQAEPRDPATLWSARTGALIAENYAAAAGAGDIGYFSADPFCICQDWGDFSLDQVQVTPTGEGAADAEVAFTNFGEARSQTLKLVFEGGGWRVDDIVTGDATLTRGLYESTIVLHYGQG